MKRKTLEEELVAVVLEVLVVPEVEVLVVPEAVPEAGAEAQHHYRPLMMLYLQNKQHIK